MGAKNQSVVIHVSVSVVDRWLLMALIAEAIHQQQSRWGERGGELGFQEIGELAERCLLRIFISLFDLKGEVFYIDVGKGTSDTKHSRKVTLRKNPSRDLSSFM